MLSPPLVLDRRSRRSCGHHPAGHADAAAVAGEVFAQAGSSSSGADPPADLPVGDPEDQGLLVGLRAAHLEESSPGAGGLEGDVLPPEISRVPEDSSDRHVDASRLSAQLGQIARASEFSGFAWRCRPGVGSGQPGQSLLGPGVGGSVLHSPALQVGVGGPGPKPEGDLRQDERRGTLAHGSQGSLP